MAKDKKEVKKEIKQEIKINAPVLENQAITLTEHNFVVEE